MDYGFLAEFDVLQLMVSDKCHEGWTKPANREAAIKYFKLRRAREEIERLNLEIYRLEHSIRTETKQMRQALDSYWPLRMHHWRLSLNIGGNYEPQ